MVRVKMAHIRKSRPDSGPSEYGTHKTVKAKFWSERIWYTSESQGHMLVRANMAHIIQSRPDSGPSEYGTHKKVKAICWSERIRHI